MLQRRFTTCMQIAIFLILVAGVARADWLALSGGPEGAAPEIMLTATDGGVMDLEISIPGLDLQIVTRGGDIYSLVTVPGCAPHLEAGAPELPILAQALRLPDEGTPRLEIVNAQWRALGTVRPLPSRGPLSREVDPAQVPLVCGEVYEQGGVWPAVTGELGRPFLVRDRRGVALKIYPVRWNADRGELQALVSLQARVTVRGQGGINVVSGPLATAGHSFDPIYKTLFNESATGEKSDESDDQGVGYGASERMLVITSPELRSAAGELAAWKRECGYDVDVVDMDELGGNTLGVHAAVQDYYFSDEGLAHLVLLGDVAQVPTNSGNYQGADSDGHYGLLSGDDLYVDILVSRLPARNSDEARLMVDRSVTYERAPQPDATWYATAVGIASNEGDPADYERADWLLDALLTGDYTNVGRIYQGFGGAREDIAAAVNNGVSLVNYLGHGSGTAWLSVPFTNVDVHQLTNTQAWPWIIDVSCTNGDFSRDECFAEAWLRASHDGEPAGAVAMISASTATSWVPPCVMQEAMVNGLVAAEQIELGALYAAGVAAVLVQYEGLPQAIKLMEQYNLFGDGSLQVRTRAPETLAVSHASFVYAGGAAFAVNLPVGARAVLTDGGTSVVLARAVAGPEGLVQLVPWRSLELGETVRLTVTARNAAPYRVELPVATAPTVSPAAVPELAALAGNYPNPFNPTTTVGFVVPAAGPVRLSLHDARGRLVRVLVDQTFGAGSHEVRWDGRDAGGRMMASGVYLARLETTHGRDVIKMTLTK